MNKPALHVVIRTPEQIVFDGQAWSLRVPTESGQVGLRPGCEATVLSLEPGLILLRHEGGTWYAGTAGGLLHCDGKVVSLMTPLAVVGDELAAVLEELERAVAVPSAEKEARTIITRLEKNILREVQLGGDQRIGSVGE